MDFFAFLILYNDEKVVKIKIHNQTVVDFLLQVSSDSTDIFIDISSTVIANIKDKGGLECFQQLHMLTLFSLAGAEKREDIRSFLINVSQRYFFRYLVF